ncbi:hypothetical protein ASPWEDRAFT_171513 [Aspergillus wentii DTO 134E9]|uniref:Uncharacterized protein n=1 Tax=Aspergillus wentii DTO 134E9 TaxID=1073089 RepID=A0A1L9RIC8_ASPWE|nr:uncharacterized protein ASPWEDRAFT_171513 [Aspergillus wentii DTO 134E9]KAI9932360.1 hypothetical protein MW887_009873 [Aspergillus wentii]OJJ34674.1 hypothetical protein ASPWEDRAFT_171513 [Aspergillus wentii DTO 134E9]
MRREMRSEEYFKIEKECSAAIALDVTETDASVDAGVNDDAAAMFTGEACDAYVKAIVGRVVASQNKDEAIQGRKLVQRRVNEALERIEEREKYEKEIDTISTNIKADEKQLAEERTDNSQDEEIKRLKGEEENKQKVEQEKAKALWEDRKRAGTEGNWWV